MLPIEGFMQYLAAQRMTGVTRVRKLAAIRKFFTFLEENSILASNPANTVKGAKREEKEPTILYKEQYKALLYEASENLRDYAIIRIVSIRWGATRKCPRRLRG